jgi:hypothetical protein
VRSEREGLWAIKREVEPSALTWAVDSPLVGGFQA